MKNVLALLSILMISSQLQAAKRDHWGYVDANQESQSESYILEFDFMGPPEKQEESFINEELVEELRSRYQNEFGYTDAQRGLNYMEYFFQSNQQNVGNIEEAELYLEKQQDFANFTLSRLGERALDQILMENKSLRPAYEVKQRVTRFQIKPQARTEISGDYNLSGNILKFWVKNPNYKLQISTKFKSGRLGPTPREELYYEASSKLTRSLDLRVYYQEVAEITDVVLHQQFTANLSMVWQNQWQQKEKVEAEVFQNTYLGLSYVF
ncbi:MAG: hypothetical protein VX642_11335 [Bdellovibrionota bacterium]|nr:hypothetical protein [Bdellovibrionota bacterium]